MARGLIQATAARSGTAIIVDGNSCIVRSNDISKSGKHGASKCRIEAIGILDDKKRVIAVPGHERFEIPMIDKRKGQILSIGEKASLMDLESFETLENVQLDDDVKGKLKEGDQVEYWNIEGRKIIKRTS